MVAERAGYTATIFVIDVSSSMRKMRNVDLPEGPNGETQMQMTNLQWGLQFVLLKIQEMIFHKRKTDQCGVILVGTEETRNHINESHGGYENVVEFIPIAHPTPDTLSKVAALEPSDGTGDPLDGVIVGLNVQAEHLANKATWTRKMVVLTDGENPIQTTDWELTADALNSNKVVTSIIGIDFNDEELPFEEEGKSDIKRDNEAWFKGFVERLDSGLLGSCAYVLQECARPDIKVVKSTLVSTVLKIGDTEEHPDESVELSVRTSKATMQAKAPTMKKFIRREPDEEHPDADISFALVGRKTEYYIDKGAILANVKTEDGEEEDKEEAPMTPKIPAVQVEKETLVKGFKYGSTYVLCPDGQFERMATTKGLEFCGFFPARSFRREWSIGEVYYIWAEPTSARDQLAFSSMIQAMIDKEVVAQMRLTTNDGMDPKMGVAMPRVIGDKDADCLLWVQMPFAEDYRRYPFRSFDRLVSKSGTIVTKHSNLVTDEMQTAMDDFVDSMDLMTAGEKNDEGDRPPWFDTIYSYCPNVHRTKQALFHAAIVSDLETNPLPPPHPELTKFFGPPPKVVKRSRKALEQCQAVFNIKQAPKKVPKRKPESHLEGEDDEDEGMLLDSAPIAVKRELNIKKDTSPLKLVKKETVSGGESDEEDYVMLDTGAPSTSTQGQPAPARAPGRIIGNTRPLHDFKTNLAEGDIVSKAVEDLAWVIQDILERPFSSRRTDELLSCMKELRHTCLQEDEIEQWNEFIRELKDKCHDDEWMGNKAFWEEVQKLGRPIGLITKAEAETAGGRSRVSESTAAKFLQD